MSVLIVRVLTSSRDASSRPDQSRRACSMASSWSRRVDVCHMFRQFGSNRGTNPSAIASSVFGMTTNTTPQPFQIKITDAELDDLQRRLDATRWADSAPDTRTDFTRGVPLPYLQELTEYWRRGFDWRAQEA